MPCSDVDVTGGEDRVAPIFRLLGEGRLTPAEVAALATALMAERRPDVPPHWLARARQIGLDARPLDGAWASAGHRPFPRLLHAALLMEQRPWLAVAGVRGARTGFSRLLFTVDDYEVVIQGTSRPSQRCHELTGQILRDGEPVPSAAIMLAGASRRSETEADAEGSFRFRDLAEGSYELDVWTGEDLIVCTPVVVGAAAAAGLERR
jgi:hypothetical protein